MRARFTERWYATAARPSLLEPLSWLYARLIALRRRAYESGWLRRQHAARPVIVIGNLSVGGTGKTPLTLWLAQQLRARGRKVGILSRGYGRRGGAPRLVQPDSDWREVGDEPLLLARRSACATVVASDRAAGARLLEGLGVELILCDDGLQHLALARDCEIVVLDGARGFGNGRLLPAGPLREPAARLGHADLVVVNGAPEHPSLAGILSAGGLLRMELAPGAAQRVDGQQAPRPLSGFRGAALHAVAGIGNPARFFAELRAQGLNILEHAFADHHAFTPADLAFADQLPVLMTEKDAVKCVAFADARLWYVPVSAQFSDADAQRLLGRVLMPRGDRVSPGVRT
jgi:tetraacyldisaccharide 4'-kinase